MGMPEVLVPEAPGVLAAFGLLSAAIEHHHARTVQAPTEAADLDAVNRCLGELDTVGRARMREEGVPPSEVRVAYAADMRYSFSTSSSNTVERAPPSRRLSSLINLAAPFAMSARLWDWARM
jgi:N-methylhydantoinase A/oxoprolinase/acetone carboxylase beta subunit